MLGAVAEAPDRQEVKDRWLGLAIILVLLGVGGSVFAVGQAREAWEDSVIVATDFTTITGLRRGSMVQLAGVQIGRVKSIDFYEAQYECNPSTEDRGRVSQGRTDDCDAMLFCAPEGLCGGLEPWTSKELHAPCLDDHDCGVGAVCVTKQFRRRYSRVYWAGWDNVCARYTRWQNRVQVTMEVDKDMFHLIRKDSRAVVASNSVLGDQLVSLTRGVGEPLEPGGRIQSTPSIYEDLEMFRQRVEVMSGKLDEGLGAISGVFGQLNDERMISDLKDRIASLDDVTRQIARGEGPIGDFFGDQSSGTFTEALGELNAGTARVDRVVAQGHEFLGQVDRELQPDIDDARQSMAQFREKVADLRDPHGKSSAATLLYDPSGARLREVEEDIYAITGDIEAADEGRGTVGKLINDNDLFHSILDLFGFTERAEVLRRTNRHMLEQYEQREGTVPAASPESRPADQ